MALRQRAPAHRWRRLSPWLVVGAGALFLAWLLTLTRPAVFFSGDAGLKVLLVEQFARGELHADLRLHAEPWARELWSAGLFPFDSPFVYATGDRVFACYPLLFELLTAPFYAVLGWPGLYLWPVIGLIAVWLTLWRACRATGLDSAWTALALLATIFGTPLTLYGAMFWEHTLGVALAFGGVTLLAAPALRSPLRNGLLAGGVLGLSVWLRSELVWLAAITVAALPFARWLGVQVRGRRAFLGGLALAACGLLTWNTLAYGDALGPHARLVVGGSFLASRAVAYAENVRSMAPSLALHGPVVGLAVLAAVALHLSSRTGDRRRGEIRLWSVLGAAYMLGVALVLPAIPGGAGGTQFGPRHLLVVFPIASLTLAHSARDLWDRSSSRIRAALGAVLGFGICAGALVNAVSGGINLSLDYQNRVLPVLEAARANAARTVVVMNQNMSLELAPLFATRQFLKLRDVPDLKPVGLAMARAGERRFLLVMDFPGAEWEVRVMEGSQAVGLRVHRIGCYGALEWCLHDVRVDPIAVR